MGAVVATGVEGVGVPTGTEDDEVVPVTELAPGSWGNIGETMVRLVASMSYADSFAAVLCAFRVRGNSDMVRGTHPRGKLGNHSSEQLHSQASFCRVKLPHKCASSVTFEVTLETVEPYLLV